MSTSGANLRVRVSADLADIKQGLAVLRGDMAKLKREGERSAPDTARWKASLGSIRTQLAGVLSVYAALRAVRWYTDQADEAANLAGRLRLATKSQQEFAAAQRGTYQIAQRSSAELGTIVSLYASLAQTTGMSQQGVLALTDVITQSFRVSGASAQDASNGLRQIQQALAGGTLRAEEFNSIIETSPRIVQALADHFGISFGQVRQYVNEGKVSSREFAEAMLKASGDIQQDFDKLPVTVSSATQQVRNALLAMVGDTDNATGASNDLATSILELARMLESPEVMSGFNTFVGGIATAVGALMRFMSTTANVTKFLAESVAARVAGPMAEDTVRVEARIERIKRTMQAVANTTSMNPLKRLDILNASELVPSDFVRGPRAALQRLQGELDKENAKLKLGIELKEGAAAAAAAAAANTGAATAAVSIDNLLEGMATGSGGKGGGKGSAKGATQKKVEQLAESTTLARDEIERALRAITQAFDDGAMSAADYYAQRTALQEQVIDLQLQELRSELALAESASRRRDIEERIAILERDRAQVAIDNARDQIKAQDELNRKKAEGFGSRLSSITSSLSTQEGSISAQVGAGMLGAGEGERQLNALRDEALVKLRALRAEQQAYLDDMKGDGDAVAGAVEGLAQIDQAIAEVSTRQQTWKGEIEDIGANALGGFFNDLIDGAKSFKDAFKDMVSNFLKGVAQMIAQQLALNAVKAIGRAFGAAHGGGVAGSLRMFRNGIDPGVFAMAPRYHGGGVAGLMSNEVPAILQRGEVIRTRQQETALAAQLDAARNGGNAAAPIRNIIVFSEDELANAMSGAAGEKVIVNHARRNRGALNG